MQFLQVKKTNKNLRFFRAYRDCAWYERGIQGTTEDTKEVEKTTCTRVVLVFIRKRYYFTKNNEKRWMSIAQ